LEKIKKQGKENTEFYNNVFKAEPNDNQIDFFALRLDREEFNNKSSETLLKEYENEKHRLKGHYVEYPTKFMIEENLELQASNVVTKLVPAINFV
jgi:hypothetical protein